MVNTNDVPIEFYIKDNGVIVSAERTSSTLNQLTTDALGRRLNQTVSFIYVMLSLQESTAPQVSDAI